ncbi:hypothetical protein LVJ94_30680 [Pendulispora rubella]|uniref:2-isopropylmalate synthase n=1 Tax=Pendulispora rubella TaxID=2741070 RepID=A0ABZ2KW91_9BACT
MAALRYTRQVRLADVGPSGQERLGGLHAHVIGDDLAARVEALYLAGAGASVEVEHEAIAAAARALNPEIDVTVGGTETGTGMGVGTLGEGARDVAAGAMRALLKLRAALEET